MIGLLISFVIRELQIRTIVRYQYVRVAKIQNTATECWWVFGVASLLFLAGHDEEHG